MASNLLLALLHKMWIYEKTKDNKARFVLGTKGKNPLICFGINPSTAEPNNLDPTLATVHRISEKLPELDSFIMFNVYPQRATDPNNLHKEAIQKLKKENEAHIAKIIDYKEYAVWAAWGNLIEKRPYLAKHMQDIISLPELAHCNWLCRGEITKKCHPHHPLYVKNDVEFKAFNIEEYKKVLNSIIK